MIRIFFILCISFFSITTFGQLSNSIDSAYQLIKSRSIHANSVDWKNVDEIFQSNLLNAKNDLDSVNCLLKVFELIKDVHSQIYYKSQVFANYPDFDDSTLKYLMPLVQKSQEQTGIIKTKLLKKKYVYFQLPGIQAGGDGVNNYAQAISDSLSQYNVKKVKGIILDLRLNGGGQLSSMLAGLYHLLGDAYLGGGVDTARRETRRMELKDGNFFINDIPMTSIKKFKATFQNKPVIILIGPSTRSSGSITAIAFKGRKNTFFIGENTAQGYTTGNDYFAINENFILNLSTEFNRDRNLMIYENSVPPDQWLRGKDDFENLMNDSKIVAAFNQLKKMK
jgi:carboxyl-terminal processing protease